MEYTKFISCSFSNKESTNKNQLLPKMIIEKLCKNFSSILDIYSFFTSSYITETKFFDVSKLNIVIFLIIFCTWHLLKGGGPIWADFGLKASHNRPLVMMNCFFITSIWDFKSIRLYSMEQNEAKDINYVRVRLMQRLYAGENR